jgi:hypothetical protein
MIDPRWQILRWVLVSLVLGGSLWLFVDTVRQPPEPHDIPFELWYGNWRAVLLLTGIFTLFLLGFSIPRRRAEWQNAGSTPPS